MRTNISAAILAGGPGSRMKGLVKPKIILDGKTILDRSLIVLKNIFSEIILVTNSPETYTGYEGLLITSDHLKGIGPLAGIHAALKAASGDAVFIFAGDMPLLNNDLIMKQAGFFEGLNCDILIPRTGTDIEPLHSIYKRSILPKLEDYISTAESMAVRDFCMTVNVKFMDIEKDRHVSFLNINSDSDISEVERIFKTGRHKNTLE